MCGQGPVVMDGPVMMAEHSQLPVVVAFADDIKAAKRQGMGRCCGKKSTGPSRVYLYCALPAAFLQHMERGT